MDRFHLRPAVQDDAPAIRKLVRAERLNPIGLDWRRFVVTITTTGDLIGCGQVKIHRERSGNDARELASIVVEPVWRGQGVARAVIEYLLAAHPPPIYLTCRASLRPFYARFGFQIISGTNLPPYFRRVSYFIGILRRIGITNEDILVMSRG